MSNVSQVYCCDCLVPSSWRWKTQWQPEHWRRQRSSTHTSTGHECHGRTRDDSQRSRTSSLTSSPPYSDEPCSHNIYDQGRGILTAVNILTAVHSTGKSTVYNWSKWLQSVLVVWVPTEHNMWHSWYVLFAIICMVTCCLFSKCI